MTRSAVRGTRTAGKSERVTETPEYAPFVRRVLRAYSARVEAGDIEAVAGLAALAGDSEAALKQAVHGLYRRGYSWSDIGKPLGITKQSASERFGPCPIRRAVLAVYEMAPRHVMSRPELGQLSAEVSWGIVTEMWRAISA